MRSGDPRPRFYPRLADGSLMKGTRRRTKSAVNAVSGCRPAACSIVQLGWALWCAVLALCSLECVGPFERDGRKLPAARTPVTYITWSVRLVAAGLAMLRVICDQPLGTLRICRRQQRHPDLKRVKRSGFGTTFRKPPAAASQHRCRRAFERREVGIPTRYCSRRRVSISGSLRTPVISLDLSGGRVEPHFGHTDRLQTAFAGGNCDVQREELTTRGGCFAAGKRLEDFATRMQRLGLANSRAS